jgi:hypothetical protein
MFASECGQKVSERSRDFHSLSRDVGVMRRFDSDDKVEVAELVHRVRDERSARGHAHEALVHLESIDGLLQEPPMRIW